MFLATVMAPVPKTAVETRSPRLPRGGLAALGRILRGRLPGQAVIQFTTRCNAACAQCGMRRDSDCERFTMDVDALKRELDAMALRGIRAVSFTGGEPLLHAEQVAECMRHAAAAGIPHVRTGTNGFFLCGADRPGFRDRVTRMAELLADTPMNAFWISLDSADPALHERNRGLPGVVEGIRRGLPIFHEHGIYPAANLGINRLTGGEGAVPGPFAPGEAFDDAAVIRVWKKAFRSFYRAAVELGFTTANACYPMSVEPGGEELGAVYAATATDPMVRFTRRERAAMLRALYEVVPEFRHRLRIFTPRSSLLALSRQHLGLDRGLFPCRGGRGFFFVDARDMHAYPCGYRGGEDLGRMSAMRAEDMDTGRECELCDWECFRDPSVLAAPLLRAFSKPVSLLGQTRYPQGFFRVWREDLRYYRACGWFDCRRGPELAAMRPFGINQAGSTVV